jgi:hypothetical protein
MDKIALIVGASGISEIILRKNCSRTIDNLWHHPKSEVKLEGLKISKQILDLKSLEEAFKRGETHSCFFRLDAETEAENIR